jgi:cytochrome c2
MNYNLIIRVGRKGKSPEQKVSHCNGCHKIEKKNCELGPCVLEVKSLANR